ncbi:beta-2 adrenergic receptor-like [Oculina patagonica]
MSATKTDEGRESYWYWILISVIAFVTVYGNALVIYLIATRPRLHITPNWFILSLSIADFSIGLIVAPSYIVYTFWVDINFTILVMFYNLLLYASVGNLCAMSFDRYIAITRPLRYVSLMKNSMVLRLIAFAWEIKIAGPCLHVTKSEIVLGIFSITTLIVRNMLGIISIQGIL